MLAGVLLSNLTFVLAACSLYALGVEVLRDRRLARAAPLTLSPNPDPNPDPNPNPNPDPSPNPNP